MSNPRDDKKENKGQDNKANPEGQQPSHASPKESATKIFEVIGKPTDLPKQEEKNAIPKQEVQTPIKRVDDVTSLVQEIHKKILDIQSMIDYDNSYRTPLTSKQKKNIEGIGPLFER